MVLAAGCDEPLAFLGVQKIERAPQRPSRDDRPFTQDSGAFRNLRSSGLLMQRQMADYGRAEMARMNAAESVYRDVVERYEARPSDAVPQSHVFLKLYRNYTRYEILGMRSGESESYPIDVRIRFEYNVLSTHPRPADDAGSADAARADTNFDTLRQESIVFEYPYRLWRRFDSAYSPPILSRPNYFQDPEEEYARTAEEIFAP